MRRALSAAIVVAAAALAWAASGTNQLTAAPTIVVIDQVGGATGSGGVQLNATLGTVSVADIAQDLASCDSGVTVMNAGTPFTVTAGTPHGVTVLCSATATLGMRRCLFHVQDATASTLVSFEGVCMAESGGSLVASTTELDFGQVTVGTSSAPQTFMVTNMGSGLALGELELQIDDDLSDDFLLGAPCNPDDNGCDVSGVELGSQAPVTVDVICHPQSAAPLTGHVYATFGGKKLGTPVTVTCNGSGASGPAIALVPSTELDLGGVDVLGGIGSGTITIESVGSQPLTVNQITIAGGGGDWQYTADSPCDALPCTVQAANSVDLHVTLKPSQIGSRPATLTIMSNDPNNPQVTIDLLGVGLGALLTLDPSDPTSIDFGYVPKNGTASVALQLDNGGNLAVDDVSLSLNPTTSYSTMPSGTTSVPANGATPIMLTCAPGGSVGTFMTTFTASAPDTVNNMPVVVTATCRGTDMALIASPSSIQLHEIRTGTSPPPTTIMLKNVGASTITLTGDPTLDPPVAALALTGPSMLSIPAGSSVPIMLAVDTSADADLTTQIQVSDTDGDMLQIPVTGSVVTAAVMVQSSVHIGQFCVNEQTSGAHLTLTSSGTAKITATAAPTMAMSPSQFAITLDTPATYPSTLAPGDAAQITVAPLRQTQPVALADDVVWSTDVAGQLMPATHVTAEFLDSGAAVAPGSLDFGQVPVHIPTPDAMPVTIQNCSPSGTILLMAAIDAPFDYDRTQFPASLASAASATFGVEFHPTELGSASGMLRIMPMGQPELDVTLTGVGIANSGEPDGGTSQNGLPSTSFYACTCSGGGAGGWPIPLAAAIVIARRRRGSSSAR
ncbi:MAG TPA: choice-of-anchor D domain-containing protein [Kofleriaceae bacterium]|nr:choice-of-anchor D domain-containing protein [Kofleriaceae bacterium]